MQSTVAQALSQLHAGMFSGLRNLLIGLADRLISQATASAGLVINGAAATFPKIGATAFQAVANGVAVTLGAGTALAAPSGSISAGKYNVFVYYIDSSGTVTQAMGTEGATLAAVKFPQTPQGKAIIGYLIVTYASPFVGGTTALDTATTVYVSPVGAFDPSISMGYA